MTAVVFVPFWPGSSVFRSPSACWTAAASLPHTKLTEQSENVYENKEPLWRSCMSPVAWQVGFHGARQPLGPSHLRVRTAWLKAES